MGRGCCEMKTAKRGDLFMSAAALHNTAAKHLLIKLAQKDVATGRAATRVHFYRM